jgi:hypothetical protein
VSGYEAVGAGEEDAAFWRDHGGSRLGVEVEGEVGCDCVKS